MEMSVPHDQSNDQPGVGRRTLLARGATVVGAAAAASALANTASADAAAKQISTIQIPRLTLNKAVYSGTAAATLALGGFGHWLGTGMPGKVGHCMLFAHRTSAGGPLRRAQFIRRGDKITAGGVTYTVTERVILRIADIRKAIDWTPGKGKKGLSIVTCTRLDGTPTSLAFRMVIRAVA
jgi:LPXTG-site transpeptidase (sortase) family protein